MRRIIATLLLLLCVSIIFTIPVFATPSRTIVTKAYNSYQKKKGISQYKLIDIDKNGVKEMLYYSDGRVVYLSHFESEEAFQKNATGATFQKWLPELGKYFISAEGTVLTVK